MGKCVQCYSKNQLSHSKIYSLSLMGNTCSSVRGIVNDNFLTAQVCALYFQAD